MTYTINQLELPIIEVIGQGEFANVVVLVITGIPVVYKYAIGDVVAVERTKVTFSPYYERIIAEWVNCPWMGKQMDLAELEQSALDQLLAGVTSGDMPVV